MADFMDVDTGLRVFADGRAVAYLTKDFEPTSEEDAEVVKVMEPDGETTFLFKDEVAEFIVQDESGLGRRSLPVEDVDVYELAEEKGLSAVIKLFDTGQASASERVAILSELSTLGSPAEALAGALRGLTGHVYVEWDEAKHPRQPPGSDKGGEFAPSEITLGAGVTRSPYSNDAIMYRGKFYHKVKNIVRSAPGKFTITTRHGDYLLEGGKKFGGTPRDWFLKGPHLGVDKQGRDYMSVTGVQDALNLLEHSI